jgi:hypothetical protein
MRDERHYGKGQRDSGRCHKPAVPLKRAHPSRF